MIGTPHPPTGPAAAGPAAAGGDGRGDGSGHDDGSRDGVGSGDAVVVLDRAPDAGRGGHGSAGAGSRPDRPEATGSGLAGSGLAGFGSAGFGSAGSGSAGSGSGSAGAAVVADTGSGHRRGQATLTAATIAGVLLVLPIFLHVNGLHIGLGQPNRATLRSPGVTVPVNVLAVAAMAVAVTWWRRAVPARVPRSRVALLATFAAVQIVAFCWGTLSHPAGKGWSLGALYLVQALLPLGAYVLFYRLGAGGGLRVVRTVALVAAMELGVVCFLLLVATAVAGTDPLTGFHDRIGPFVISKAARFFPTAVSVFAGFALLEGWRRRRVFPVAAGLAGMAVLAIGHSRTALLIGLALPVVTGIRLSDGRRRLLLIGSVLLSVGLGLFALTRVPPSADGSGSGVLRSVSRLADAVHANEDNDNRLAAITGSLTTGLGRPFGNAYQATEELGTNGRPTAVARVAVSENLYGELAARSGPLGLAAFLAVLVVALRGAASLRADHEGDRVAVAWLAPALTILVLLGGLTQLNATEFYIAPVSWGLMGLAVGVADRQRRRPVAAPSGA